MTSYTGGTGAGGQVKVQAPLVRVDGGVLEVDVYGNGHGGDVAVVGDQIQVVNGGAISSITAGSGAGGQVNVQAAEAVTVAGQDNAGNFSEVTSRTIAGSGAGGQVTVRAPLVRVSDGGVIRTYVGAGDCSLACFPERSSGHGGDVTVAGDNIQMVNGGQIYSRTIGSGDGGQVRLQANHVILENAGIRTESEQYNKHRELMGQASGKGGDIQIKTDSLQMSDGAYISTDTASVRDGGSIEVQANSMILEKAGIATGSFTYEGVGNGGDIRIRTDHLQMSDGAAIIARTGFAKAGGSIDVQASSLDLEGADEQLGVTTSIETTADYGISVGPGGAGKAGDIRLRTDMLHMSGGAQILANTFLPDSSGSIDVQAKNMALEGANEKLGATTRIAIEAFNASVDKLGDIRIKTDNLQMRGGAAISTATKGGGLASGGFIDVQASNMVLEGADKELATPTRISADSLVDLSTLGAGGKAGDILIRTGTLQVKGDARITAQTHNKAAGGSLSVQANSVVLDGGTISANSFQEGNAGNIQIQADESFRSRNGHVTTEATQAGGGNITVAVGQVIEFVDSDLTTTAQGGSGNAGNIAVKASAMALNRSTVRAQADAGKGGNITIATDLFVPSPDSVVSASAGPAGVSGTVDIRGVVNNLSGNLAPLTQEYQSAPALVADRCAGRLRAGSVSSFVVTGRSGLPVQPGGLLPSAALVSERGNVGRAETHRDTPLTEQDLSTTHFVLSDDCAWAEGR